MKNPIESHSKAMEIHEIPSNFIKSMNIPKTWKLFLDATSQSSRSLVPTSKSCTLLPRGTLAPPGCMGRHEVSQLVPHNSSFTLVYGGFNRLQLVYSWGLRSNNNSQASLVVWMVVIALETITMVDFPASHVQFVGWLRYQNETFWEKLGRFKGEDNKCVNTSRNI